MLGNKSWKYTILSIPLARWETQIERNIQTKASKRANERMNESEINAKSIIYLVLIAYHYYWMKNRRWKSCHFVVVVSITIEIIKKNDLTGQNMLEQNSWHSVYCVQCFLCSLSFIIYINTGVYLYISWLPIDTNQYWLRSCTIPFVFEIWWILQNIYCNSSSAISPFSPPPHPTYLLLFTFD